MILFCATLLIFIMLVERGGSITLYMGKIVEPVAMDAFLQRVALVVSSSGEMPGFQRLLDLFGLLINIERTNVPNVTFAFFNLMGITTTLIGVLLSKSRSMAFGKRAVFVPCLILTALSTAWLCFIPTDSVGLMFFQALSLGACLRADDSAPLVHDRGCRRLLGVEDRAPGDGLCLRRGCLRAHRNLGPRRTPRDDDLPGLGAAAIERGMSFHYWEFCAYWFGVYDQETGEFHEPLLRALLPE